MERVNMEPLERMFGDLLADMEQEGRRAARKRAEADPKKHKLSRIFSRGEANYYFAAHDGTMVDKEGRRRQVIYCWSIHRNVAGYFLSWRETTLSHGGRRRDMLRGFKVKRQAKEQAYRRVKSHQAGKFVV